MGKWNSSTGGGTRSKNSALRLLASLEQAGQTPTPLSQLDNDSSHSKPPKLCLQMGQGSQKYPPMKARNHRHGFSNRIRFLIFSSIVLLLCRRDYLHLSEPRGFAQAVPDALSDLAGLFSPTWGVSLMCCRSLPLSRSLWTLGLSGALMNGRAGRYSGSVGLSAPGLLGALRV